MIEIRPLLSKDYGAYAFLRERALDSFPSAFFSSNAEEQAHRKQRFDQVAQDLSDFHLGAFVDQIMIGVAVFTIPKRLKRRHIGNISGVFVLKKYQNQGVERLLLIKAMGKASEIETLEKFNLSVGTKNVHAVKLYLSLGFEIYGEEKKALRIGDVTFDEYYMSYHF